MRLIEYIKLIKALKRRQFSYKEVEEDYYKKCFKLFNSVNGENEKLISIAKNEGVSSTIIYINAKEYAKKNLGYTEEKWNTKYSKLEKIDIIEKRKRDIFPCEINNLFLDLIIEDNPEKIVYLINEVYFDKDIQNLRLRISNFVVSYFPTEKDYLIDSLKSKIDIYKKYVDEQIDLIKKEREEDDLKLLQQEEQIIYANNKQIINLFIKEEYNNKQTFCDKRQIEYDYFDYLIELSQKYDDKTYQEYKGKVLAQRNRRFEIILEMIDKIIDYLRKGIENQDGTIREFDIIDYYMITKIEFNELLKIIKESNKKFAPDDLRIFQKFLQKYKKASKTKTNEIVQILNPQNIETIGKKTITYNERLMIINFLKENHIPQNIITYRCCRNRCLNNIIEAKENPKTKTRKLINKRSLY